MSKTNIMYNQTAQEVVAQLSVDSAVGLSAAEIAKRKAQYGPNALPNKPRFSIPTLIFRQFKDVLIIVLLVAATVSLAVALLERPGHVPTEALLIYGIVIAIAMVGFFNEFKAEKTVEALRGLISQTCRVRRDGREQEIDTAELVPGDIVLLEEGKKIPADMRILRANRLQVNEASLTGESSPENKQSMPLKGDLALADQTNMLFSGTLVTTGTAEGVVVATGAMTEIGAIARMVNELEDDETPMQRKLNQLGRRLGFIILGICVLVFVVILAFNHEHDGLNLTQRMVFAFTAAVALAVAAIPEGLAFVVRISLALGARRMAAKKALVRRLSAVESLGSTDIICTDKTGTLTKGEMTVRLLYADGSLYELSGTGYDTRGELTQDTKRVAPTDDLEQLCEIGLLCNNARLADASVLGDPTEAALLVSAAKLGQKHADAVANNPRVHEIPFSSERKMMSTVHRSIKGYTTAVKGATSVILPHCTHELRRGRPVPLTPERKDAIEREALVMASHALRVLAFAYRKDTTQPTETEMEQGLIFVGLQAMMDPPRIEVKQVIERVQRDAGMRVIMITGDGIETAKAVAREVGITGEAMTGLQLDTLTDDQLHARIEQFGVYARVSPAHKIRIVQALKSHGHQVAMTGDGVNDAPALKAADIGVAMGITGTDAAKEAADVILLDDQFLTIIKAVEEGRGIFDNVRKFVTFLLSCNIGEVITVLLGVLIHQNLVLTAAQLLFINIITDGLPAVALGSDPASDKVMQFKPRHYQQAIINRRVWFEIFIFGGMMAVLLLLHYTLIVDAVGAVAASSVVFLAMVVYEFARLLDIRSDFHMKWFSNRLLTVSLSISLCIQMIILYVPPFAAIFTVMPVGLMDWVIIIVVAVALLGIMKLLNPVLDIVGPEYAGTGKPVAAKK
ncbi:MAG TPA: calcium-translocating P-type ATPase, PMCA-type [Candidatus Saccharimonadales bacterium]|nr:calcium-translocating P-type ATPase, PMCA-type [Candidatus Saccharimonadales bacterium]